MESQDLFMKHIGNTSTPTQESRSGGTSTSVELDDSSSALQSILGVNSDPTPIKNTGTKKKSHKRGRMKDGNIVEGIGPVDCTRHMISQEQCVSRSISLDQVIAKVTQRPVTSLKLPVTPSRPVTRSRSLSVGGNLSDRKTANLGTKSLSGFKAVLSKPNKQGRGVNREGTPESDAGYGTSVQSGSPDNNLAELVRAMKLQSVSQPSDYSPSYSLDHVISTVSTARRSKLSSISEQDPAVTQAVKSNTVPHHQPSGMGPNLLSTLLGYSAPTDDHLQEVNSLYTPHFNSPGSLEVAAKLYRNAASIYEANCTWSGQLPTTDLTFSAISPMYSTKVFLGGVPWDVTEQCLSQSFRQFGSIRVEWPGKVRADSCSPKGYLYVIFEGEGAVASLLEHCTHDFSGGGAWYYRISSRRTRSKDVQVIPWLLADSNFVRCSSPRLDPNKTVFVGALHGMLTAESLAHVFNDLFGGVVYAGIDTDRFKYPIGSGRVTFNSNKSYMKAVSAAFIEVKTSKFVKKVQVDPYLEDKVCTVCGLKQGPYFCRDLACFTYYCRYCWELLHCSSLFQHHKPLMRKTRGGGGALNRPIEPPGLYLPGLSD